MGKFSNPNHDGMVGTRLGPSPEIPGDSGFDAMGKPIPLYRQQAAYDCCKQIGMTDKEKIWDCVRGMTTKLERDEPALAMEHAINYVDAAGVYRLMAVLLTTEKPSDDEVSEWDFMVTTY